MQPIDLKADDILNLDQINRCLADASNLVMHCADNYLPIELVMKLVEAELLGRAKRLCEVGGREYEREPSMMTPPWAVPATAPVTCTQPKRRATAKRQK